MIGPHLCLNVHCYFVGPLLYRTIHLRKVSDLRRSLNCTCLFYVAESGCTYNDRKGESYLGKQAVTENGYTCGSWTLQTAYPATHFPDGSLEAAENYCRNPKPTDYRTWCYYRLGSQKKWDYCTLRKCGTLGFIYMGRERKQKHFFNHCCHST